MIAVKFLSSPESGNATLPTTASVGQGQGRRKDFLGLQSSGRGQSLTLPTYEQENSGSFPGLAMSVITLQHLH